MDHFKYDGASTNIYRTTGFGQKMKKIQKSGQFSTGVHRGGFSLVHINMGVEWSTKDLYMSTVCYERKCGDGRGYESCFEK